MSRSSNDTYVSGTCRQCGRRGVSLAMSTCPECGGAVIASAQRVGLLSVPHMRYPSAYVWFIFISWLDLLLTWMVLLNEGAEVNPIADAVLSHAGSTGLVLFKFALVVFVVVMCEWIGRRNPAAGRRLSEWSVALTSIPVLVATVQLIAM